MQTFNWKTINRKVDATDRMVDIELTPESPGVRYFFSDVKLEKFPLLIDSAIHSQGFHNEVSGLLSYDDLDGGDFASGQRFEKGNVEIYHQVFDRTILPESLFDKMVRDYALKLLEVYRNSKEVPAGWEEEMQKKIKLLEQKTAGAPLS